MTDSMLKWVVMFMGLVFLGFICILIIPSQLEKEQTDNLKLDKCIKLANEIGFDPNDDQRGVYIESCYEYDK